MNDKEDNVVYLIEKSSNFWNSFWNIFWVVIVVVFLAWVIISPGEDPYVYETIDQYSYNYEDVTKPYEFDLVSREDLPITYSIANDCSDFMKLRIDRAFYNIDSETNSAIMFLKIIENADIEISCPLLDLGYEDTYTAGKATLGVVGYNPSGSEISFYNLESKGDVWKMGACSEYPDTEIHEILHTFGFDHNENQSSIMVSFTEGCYINSIDDYIIECLKYTYTNGEQGTNCSNRDDVIGSLDEVEYEYVYEYEYEECDDGWYRTINREDLCCPEPDMYIDEEGYCV